MYVKETDFPEKFRPIIRRLQAATQTTQIRDIMTVEDDFIAEINDIEHRAEEERKLKEEERKLKEVAISKQKEAIKLLYKTGMPIEEISKALSISLEDLKILLQ